ASLTIGLLIIGFSGYHYVSLFLNNRAKRWKKTEEDYISIIGQRLIGSVFLGVIPILIFVLLQDNNFRNYGINLYNFDQSLIWISIFAPLIVMMNCFLAGKQSKSDDYPQIRIKNWNPRTLIINFTTWLVYLFAYEAFFRGLLLFSFYYTFNSITAVVVNVILYAFVHLPKGLREMLGSVPFGIILCVITIKTGSFLAAFLIHGIMAISYEFFSIKANPEMSIKNKRI
ncbi:MAG: CPBP family intramembrane glutamic endopeptidase, partial [Bacteroidota bacterium]